VYICLQPSIAPESLQQGQCRHITGGIRFDVYTAPAPASVDATADLSSPSDSKRARLQKEIVKFSALVGQTILTSSRPVMQPMSEPFHVGQWYRGNVSIANKCTRLPLEFSIECSEFVRFETTKGNVSVFGKKSNFYFLLSRQT